MPQSSAMAAKAVRSRNEPERCCCTFGQTAELAAQTGDKHVSWVAFPSGAEERCSPHRFVTPALHANHNQQTITAEVQPPAGLALLSALHITIETIIRVYDKS